MHILMIESNPAGISGIKKVIDAGHIVTLVTVDPNFYLNTNPDTKEVFSNPSCNVVHHPDIFNTDALIKLVDKINSSNKIDGVTTYSEYHVVRAAEVAKYFNLPGMNVDGAMNARFKHRTKKKLQHTGVPQPKFVHAKTDKDFISAVNEIGFPCVIKPSDGTAGLHVVFLNNEDEFKKYLQEISGLVDYGRGVIRSKDLLVEQYIPGELVSVESCVLNKNKIINLGITDRILSGFPHFIEMGCTYFNDHPLRDQLFALNTQILKELNIDFGFIHTEFILSENGPVLCEVNGRLVGGTVPKLMNISSGIDPFVEVVNLALGIEPKLPFPGNKIACGRWFGSPVVGKLDKVDFKDVDKIPGFIEAVIYKKTGEKISQLSRSNFDWLGHVIFASESKDEAVKLAEFSLNKISLNLIIEPAK